MRLQHKKTTSGAWIVAKKKKKKAIGFVIPREIAYAMILAIIGTAWASYKQLQSVDGRLRVIEAEIRTIVR